MQEASGKLVCGEILGRHGYRRPTDIPSLEKASEVYRALQVNASRQSKRVSANVSGLLGTQRITLRIEAVRQVYAPPYPEIITAAVSGPELADGKEVFTFKTAWAQKPDKPCHGWCDGLDLTQRTLRPGLTSRTGGRAPNGHFRSIF
jgi:PRTRC genetic system protein C